MKKKGAVLERTVANLAYIASKKSANSNCSWLFHQPKQPDKVKNLRKF